MSQYASLAGCYDSMTRDIDYNSFADFYEKLFIKEGIEVRSILDLACGTGTLTCILANRGYELIGVDKSVDMLAVAFDKAMEVEKTKPLFLNQELTELDLYGTVDCAVCCLDGVNYLTDPIDLEKAFDRLKFFVNPGGLLIFDINSEFKLQGLDGGMFLDEDENNFCLWRTEYDKAAKLCFYGMDIFKKTKSGLWQRSAEEHYEYAYGTEELKSILENTGFKDISFYGDRTLQPPKPDEMRIFVTARRMNY